MFFLLRRSVCHAVLAALACVAMPSVWAQPAANTAGTATTPNATAPQAASNATPKASAPKATPEAPANTASWSAETFKFAQENGHLPGQSLAADGTVDLAHAWRLTLENDPTYQAALSEYAASQTERYQGRAGLLPQVQAGFSRSRIRGTREQPNFLGQTVQSDLDYDSTAKYVQLQQPLLNYGRFADYQRGQARADEGIATFFVKSQETGVRLAQAYFNVLLAYHGLQLQNQLVASLEGQLKTQESLFARNEGTVTDARETQARLAMVQADRILADDELRVATRELEALLGRRPTQLVTLRSDFPLPPLVPDAVSDWLSRARANNAQVRAAREAVNVAGANVDKAVSAYFPSMDLVATFSDADSENLSTLSQRSNTFTVGLQVSIPLFTGGYTTASAAQARETRRQREQEYAATLEQVEAEVTRQFGNVTGGADRIRALQASVSSGEVALEGARKGYQYGQYSNLDVLKVQDKLYRSRYDLIKAQLEYVLARMQLAMAVGDLDGPVFEQVNRVFFQPVIPVSEPLNRPER